VVYPEIARGGYLEPPKGGDGKFSQDELFDSYPNLKPEHIQAARRYAADVVSMDEGIYQ